MPDNIEQIRVAAYHLWDSRGRPEGADIEHWEEAQRVVLAHGEDAHSDSGNTDLSKMARAKQTESRKSKKK